MVRASKSTISSSTAPSSTIPSSTIPSSTVPLTTGEAVPLETSSMKKTPSEKKPKSKKSVASDVVMETLPEVANQPIVDVVATDVVVTDGTVTAVVQVADMPSKIADFNNKYNQVIAMLSGLKQSFKSIEKSAQRDWRVAQKALAKKNKKAEKRSPSGFVRPCLISDEMAEFLGVERGSMIARTTVSSKINLYIRDNNLQDKTHGRNINPDQKLATLLNVQPDSEDKLTYFNLQRYMKHHFIKTTPIVAADAVVA
jgi:chromatin remodeling complex protein RSC6